MNKNNYSLVFDENSKSLKIRNMLLKKINITPISKSDLIIVLGGDGFMLKTLKKYHKSKKKFYGINTGNYGFLMNKFSKKFKIKNLIKSKMISISPLEMTVFTKK